MKFGMRMPSFKKSFKARTSGKLKRSIKRKINPLYGKKGMGFIKNPKRAIYNKIYNKTTFSASDMINNKTSKNKNGGCLSGLIAGIIMLPFWIIYYIIKIVASLFNSKQR